MALVERNPSTSAPGDGSRTIIVTAEHTQEEDDLEEIKSDEDGVVGTLRLRGAQRKNRRKVAWDEDVIDNEGCGKKKSKICCIYHKPRMFDESSSSGSDSDSDVDSCDGHQHGHDGYGVDREHGHAGAALAQQVRSAPSSLVYELPKDDEPNAYETLPGPRKKGERTAK